MPISAYLKNLRTKIGHDALLNPGVAALIRDDAGRVLLQRRSDDGTWSLPAGAVDPGEHPAEALVREVWEETGLRVVPKKVVGVFSGPEFRHSYPNGDQIDVFSVVFLCEVTGRTLGGRDGESLELRYFMPADFPASGLLQRYPAALFSFSADDAPLFTWDETWFAGLE